MPRRRCIRPAPRKWVSGDDAVLDPASMRVHGLNGIRVVDASAFPYIPNGNTYAPVMMLAEKSADLILGNTPLPPSPAPFYRFRDGSPLLSAGRSPQWTGGRIMTSIAFGYAPAGDDRRDPGAKHECDALAEQVRSCSRRCALRLRWRQRRQGART